MKEFYKNKKVLITGCTGFKGSWMCEVLLQMGAEVIGYALEPPTDPCLFDILDLERRMKIIIGDIRDLDKLHRVFTEYRPEIVIHLAAQPIVRESYNNPVYTYDVNVMGTVNVLECIRTTDCVKSFVNVTTDKVYKNREWEWGYRENEELNGYDPYSNSKSCSELVTESYKNSFFSDRDVAISTVRAGNVIGGGDFAIDRIVPDCVRATIKKENIVVRNPYSIRPYQHVLEPVMAYLLVAKEQYIDSSVAGSYNVGPNDADCISTGDLATLFCEEWNRTSDMNIAWQNVGSEGPHEANFLKLDSSKMKKIFHWHPHWDVRTSICKSIDLYKAYYEGVDVPGIMQQQIMEYQEDGYFNEKGSRLEEN